MSVVREQAPDIGPGYPSKGPRLAAGWQRVWDTLANGQRHALKDLMTDPAVAGDLSPFTVRTLVTTAVKAGLLVREVGTRRDALGVQRVSAFVRRADR